MTIEWFRDFTIILYGIAGIAFLIFIGIMAFSIFHRLIVILDSLKVTSANIQEISTVVKEQLVKPITQVGSIFQSITKWIELICNFFKKSNK